MRVGVLVPEFPGQTHIAVWRLAKAMEELGAHIRFISTRRPPEGHGCHHALAEATQHCVYLWPPSAAALVSGFIVHPSGLLAAARYCTAVNGPLKRRLRIAGLIASAASLASLCRREQLGHVFVHSCADAAHLVAIANRLSGIRYSLRLGGSLQTYGTDHNLKMERASFIVAAAAVNKSQVHAEVGLPEEKVIWSWFGLDTRRFSSALGARSSAGPLRVITVARLNYQKGHEYALNAIAAARAAGADLRYEIIGSGAHEAAIRREITALGLDDVVELVGPLDESDVIARLQRAHCFVLPSFGTGEGSPMAVLEAMSCGVVPIASDVGGMRDLIVDDGDGFIVPPRDAEAIAAKLLRLWHDRPFLDAAGARARLRAEKDFDVAAVAARILELVKKA